MSAYEELESTGIVGDQTIALLRRLGAQYTRSHSFPPPEGHDRWTDEAVDDLLGELFAEKGPAFVLACLVGASDDASLERLLLAVIGNHLIDQAKKTERGKLRRRLDGLLTGDPRFTRVTAAQAGIAGWTLTGRATTVTARSPADLQEAACSVRGVSITRWNTAGPTPAGTQHALVTVAEAVLEVAEGVVRDEDLARAIQARFVLISPPKFTELKAGEQRDEPVAHPDDEPQALVEVNDRAEDLWQGLSQTERTLLPHLGNPTANLATLAGTGPEQAQAIADSLREKLRLATIDDAQQEDVVLELLRLCLVRP